MLAANNNHVGSVGIKDKEESYLKPLLRSLEQRTFSLEKQLEDKQRIIETLIRWSSLQVNKLSYNKETPLMRNRSENDDKGKNQHQQNQRILTAKDQTNHKATRYQKTML